MNIGELRITERIHPDSLGVKVYEVEQVKVACGKYAKEGELYWSRVTPGIEPFTSRQAAENFMSELSCKTCARGEFGPTHNGSTRCKSGSIASGGNKKHCSCDVCF